MPTDTTTEEKLKLALSQREELLIAIEASCLDGGTLIEAKPLEALTKRFRRTDFYKENGLTKSYWEDA